MPILNYTTSVPVERSLAQMQKLLVQAGARQIATNYDDAATPVGMSFVLPTATGDRIFALPVDCARVKAVLVRDKVPPRYRTPEHVARVAWRIQKDWLEAQLALLRTEMVTFEQIMLPYMQVRDGRSLFAHYLEGALVPALARGN